MSLFNSPEIQEFKRAQFIEQCIQVALCSILVYSSAITMDSEVKYCWTRQWHNLTHILYFSNRYVGIFGAITRLFLLSPDPTLHKCRYTFLCLYRVYVLMNPGFFGQLAGNISDIIVDTIVDYILMLRVLALWENSRVLSITLKFIIVGEAAVKTAIVIKSYLLVKFHPLVFAEGIAKCSAFITPTGDASLLQAVDWIISATVGFILLVLAFSKAIEHWRSSGSKGSRIVNIMIKDQIVYYVAVLVCSVLNIIKNNPGINDKTVKGTIIIYLGSPSFLCLLGSRMFIKLKEAGESQANEESGLSYDLEFARTLSSPRFVAPVTVGQNSLFMSQTTFSINANTATEINELPEIHAPAEKLD